MIIQCEQCETTYRFESSRLQNGEGQVRCVRCGNVFSVDSLSDLGEAFLKKQTPQAYAGAPKGSETQDQKPAETYPEVPSDTPVGTSEFSMDTELENDEEQDDFWSSPGEFDLDASEGDSDIGTRDSSPLETGASMKPDVSDPPLDKDSETSDYTSNEFIFEPLDEKGNAAGSSAQAGENVITEKTEDNTSSSPSTAAKKKRGKPKKKGSKLLLLLLLIILVVAGMYAYYFLAHGITTIPRMVEKAEQQINQLINPQPEPAGPSINIRSGDNFYISNEHEGSLFVINGSVTNIRKQPQGELAVIATLYASDGKRLRSLKIFCGNPISREELRSEPLEYLQERMSNRLGTGLSNVSVQPGESIPFCAVFHDLPEDFAEFSISESSNEGADK